MRFTTFRSLLTASVNFDRFFKFCLDVYQVEESGDLQCFISKEGNGLEIISMASSRVFDSSQMGDHPAEWLMKAASDEIDLNSDDQYY